MITKLEARKIVFEKRKNIKDFKDFNGCFVDNTNFKNKKIKLKKKLYELTFVICFLILC